MLCSLCLLLGLILDGQQKDAIASKLQPQRKGKEELAGDFVSVISEHFVLLNG
jgi:hypothetical protein